MKHKPAGRFCAAFFSSLYLIAAAALLLAVCGHCYPHLGQWVRQTVGGGDHSPVREAFSTLAEELGAGNSLTDSLTHSYEVLTGEKTSD